jgi:diguanylate cyclase (GGDEF)-like protein
MEKVLSLLKEMLSHCSDAIVLLDKKFVVQHANSSFYKNFFPKRKNLVGHVFSLLKNEMTQTCLKKLNQGQIIKIDLPNKKNINLQTIKVFSIENITFKNIAYMGIVERTCEINNGPLSDIEKKDPITGGLNRYGLEEVIETIIKLCKQKKCFFSILYIDIDNFDYINQLLGFKNGDLLLKKLANRFVEVSKKHYWFGRLFGDKFICISHLSSKKTDKQYHTMAKSFFDALKAPFRINNKSYFLTASIGIATFSKEGSGSDRLIQNAQIALEHAKIKFGNSVVIFNKKLNDKAKKILEIDAQLKKIDMDKELKLVYQPQVDAKTKEVIGAEALIRWHHKSLGVLSPKDFCPIATKNGVIINISRWVIENIAKTIQRWGKNHVPIVPISVNIPTIGFYQRDFVSNLKKIVKKYDIKAENLQLEVTENLMLKNVSSVIAELAELSQLGFKVTLDDFGTGFSNLSYLSQFKLHALKIDTSFVKQMHRSWQDIALIKIIIQVAKNFNLSVVAEGAETLEQVNKLRKLNCDIIQGYFFSKPIDEEKFRKFLSKHKVKRLS